MKSKVMLLCTLLCALFACKTGNVNNLQGEDWSQWRGSDMDGIYIESGLNLDWSEKQPPVSWVFRHAGAGYASPMIVGTTLYCMGAAEGSDFAFALDAQTGNLKWRQALGNEFVEERGNGPRGSITVDGDKLYLIRGEGQIHCLSAVDGKMLWQKDFKTDFGGRIMSNWGYSESPLVDGDLVICTPGGDEGTLIALDKNTGNVVWRSAEWTDQAGYSSPIVAEINGVRQYIQQASGGVAGLSAKDGKLLWKVEVPGYRIAVIPSPVYHDNTVYVTAGYNAGCTYIKLTKDGDSFTAETIYANRNLSNQHGGVVLIDGNIYGFSDTPPSWVCQDLKTGEIVWSERQSGVGKGTVLAVNDRLLLLTESGTLAVVAASPDGWKEYGRMEFPERSNVPSRDNATWTHITVAHGKLYLRDHDLLFCFDLKK